MFDLVFDPTVTIGNLLMIGSFVVSLGLAAIFWRVRLVLVEREVTTIREQIEAFEKARITRENELIRRLERIEDKIDGKADKA